MALLQKSASYSLSRPAFSGGPRASVAPYFSIARPGHWFKNAFMFLGVTVAFFCNPALLSGESLWPITLAIAATCVITSCNYVLNELVDASHDSNHPVK